MNTTSRFDDAVAEIFEFVFTVRRQGETRDSWFQRVGTMIVLLAASILAIVLILDEVIGHRANGWTYWLIVVLILFLTLFVVIRFTRLYHSIVGNIVLAAHIIILAHSVWGSRGVLPFTVLCLPFVLLCALSHFPLTWQIIAATLYSVFALLFDLEHVVGLNLFFPFDRLTLPHLDPTPIALTILRIFFGIICQCLIFYVIYRIISNLRKQEQRNKVLLSTVQQVACRLGSSDFDTRGAMSAIDDRDGEIDCDMLDAFRDIVNSINRYRSFVPRVAMMKKDAADAPQLSKWVELNAIHAPTKRKDSAGMGDSGTTMSIASVSRSGATAPNPLSPGVQNLSAKIPVPRRAGPATSLSNPPSIFDNTQHIAAIAMIRIEIDDSVDLQEDVIQLVRSAIVPLFSLAREYRGTISEVRGTTIVVTWEEDNKPPNFTNSLCAFACAVRTMFSRETPSEAKVESSNCEEGRISPTLSIQSADSSEIENPEQQFAKCNSPCGISCAIAIGSAQQCIAGDAREKRQFLVGTECRCCSSRSNPLHKLPLLFEAAIFHNASVVSEEIATSVMHAGYHVRAIDAVRFTSKNRIEPETQNPSLQRLPHVVVASFTPQSEELVKVFEVIGRVVPPSISTPPQEWVFNMEQAVAPYARCEAMTQALDKFIAGHYENGTAVIDALPMFQRADRRLAALQEHANVCHAARFHYVREFGWCNCSSPSRRASIRRYTQSALLAVHTQRGESVEFPGRELQHSEDSTDFAHVLVGDTLVAEK